MSFLHIILNMYHFSNASIAFADLENLGMDNRIDSISVRSEVMTKYLIPQKIADDPCRKITEMGIASLFFFWEHI